MKQTVGSNMPFGWNAVATIAVAAVSLAAVAGVAPAFAQAGDPAAARAAYERQLRAYEAARQTYEETASDYWSTIVAKRRARQAKFRDGGAMTAADYVMMQPPVYSGPSKPVDPFATTPEPPPERKPIPVVADFLAAAKEHYGFVPRRPSSDAEYKRAYVEVAREAGLTREQVVRIFVFEVGGEGVYDLQAGLEYKKPGARAITTALGYNQLLTANSMSLMAQRGDQFLKALRTRSATLPVAARPAFDRKIAVVERMVAYSRTVPDDWSAHEALGKTPKGLGLHALLLDVDVGPLLQVQKLVNSLVFARRRGYGGPLSAAELEMMNLMGDGNGYDVLVMPADLRAQVPTSNFFSRLSYARNPVVIRNNTVARLLAATDAQMDRGSKASGARELASQF